MECYNIENWRFKVLFILTVFLSRDYFAIKWVLNPMENLSLNNRKSTKMCKKKSQVWQASWCSTPLSILLPWVMSGWIGGGGVAIWRSKLVVNLVFAFLALTSFFFLCIFLLCWGGGWLFFFWFKVLVGLSCIMACSKKKTTYWMIVDVCLYTGRRVCHGEPERDAVHVVPDGVRRRVPEDGTLGRRAQEMPRNRQGTYCVCLY